MVETSPVSVPVDTEAVRLEVECVLASDYFRRSRTMAQFLEYVCRRSLDNPDAALKEYCIGVDALGKPAGFDPKKDATVRVEAFRLRKRLSGYYADEGASHSIHITLPLGTYTPRFIQHAPGESKVDESLPDPTEPLVLPQISVSGKSWRTLMVAVAILVLIGLAFAASWLPSRRASASNPGPIIPPNVSGKAASEIRILCGSSGPWYQDKLGNIWGGDRYSTGGTVFAPKSRPILFASDYAIFLRGREGDFQYDIPVGPGLYELWLYFAETRFGVENQAGGESARLFDIFINDKQVENRLDIISDAAGCNTADAKVYLNVEPASDGKVHIRFKSLANSHAFVNAIEIKPGQSGKMLPLRIACRGTRFVDKENREWLPDQFVRGGRILEWDQNSPDAAGNGLYASERYGHFTYSVPVAREAKYTARLYFRENWFGTQTTRTKGNRLFDVYSSGSTLLKHFDVLAEAQPREPVVKTFRGLEPTPQGKLIFDFVPEKNYALLNAIEILPEGSAHNAIHGAGNTSR